MKRQDPAQRASGGLWCCARCGEAYASAAEARACEEADRKEAMMRNAQAVMRRVAQWLERHVLPSAPGGKAVQIQIDALREAADEQSSNGQTTVQELLRKAARMLERCPRHETTLFPGWDPDSEVSMGPADRDRREGIRKAAVAILAPAVSMDEGTEVSHVHLGHLVHYMADMLEDTVVDEAATEDTKTLDAARHRELLAWALAGFRSASRDFDWWTEAVHTHAVRYRKNLPQLMGDLHTDAVSIAQLTDDPRVDEDAGCPGCGETRIDYLIWDDGKVTCSICRCTHTPEPGCTPPPRA